jgi:hypothetical protein
VILIVLGRYAINQEHSESVVIAVDENGFWNWLIIESIYCGVFFIIYSYLFKLSELIVLIYECNVDSLSSVNLVSILSEVLFELERGNLSIIFGVFV